MRKQRWLFGALAVLMVVTLASGPKVIAQSPDAAMAFHRTWERTDKPVADGVVSRTWMWGPDSASGQLQEEYAEAPGGIRSVIYSHKSRMEINHNPGVSPESVWYVTNGLLVQELITGQMQVGDSSYVPREPAEVNVAGDFDDPLGVTYRLLGFVLDEPATPEGSTITMSIGLAAASLIRDNPSMSVYGVTAGKYVPETGHTVAAPFWEFMNSSGIVYENGQFVNAPLFLNPFYATGFPITEAYWAHVKVGGTLKDVLMQCFERRCLTYTPSNDPAWRVEAGNVGLHYHAWRYGQGNDSTPEYEVALTIDGFQQVVAVDSDRFGNIYAIENGASLVGKFDRDGNVLQAWGYSADGRPFSNMYGLFVDDLPGEEYGFLYVAETINRRVSYHLTTGQSFLVWPTQSAYPYDLVHDGFARIFITDGTSIHLFDFAGNYQSSVQIQGANLRGIAIDSTGHILAADVANGRIVRVDFHKRTYDSWYGLSSPNDVAVDQQGFVYVADTGNNRIAVLDQDGAFVTWFGDTPASGTTLNGPRGVNVDEQGRIIVADEGNGRIVVFTPN